MITHSCWNTPPIGKKYDNKINRCLILCIAQTLYSGSKSSRKPQDPKLFATAKITHDHRALTSILAQPRDSFMTNTYFSRTCPACGAGISTDDQGAFTCPACGFGHTGQQARHARVPLPLKSALYDGLFLVHHLEYCPDPCAEMRRARTMLTPGGILYLEIGKDGPWTIPMAAARRLIEAAGFRIVKRVGRFSLDRSRPLRLWCRRY
jgi:predicted RNA-binding Zn-ribbon protein involved in translation (DUF1610 family)